MSQEALLEVRDLAVTFGAVAVSSISIGSVAIGHAVCSITIVSFRLHALQIFRSEHEA